MNNAPNDRNDSIDNDNRNDIKNINNIVRIDTNDIDNESNSFTLTKEELLARDLAEGLNDKASLGFYLSVCRKYPGSVLRKIYSQVKEIPASKIKKSKGALFNYLVQKYEKGGENNCD